MKPTNIAFALPARDAQALHDHLAANGILCPGPRPNAKTGLSHVVAVRRGTEAEVERVREVVRGWRESRGAGG